MTTNSPQKNDKNDSKKSEPLDNFKDDLFDIPEETENSLNDSNDSFEDNNFSSKTDSKKEDSIGTTIFRLFGNPVRKFLGKSELFKKEKSTNSGNLEDYDFEEEEDKKKDQNEVNFLSEKSSIFPDQEKKESEKRKQSTNQDTNEDSQDSENSSEVTDLLKEGKKKSGKDFFSLNLFSSSSSVAIDDEENDQEVSSENKKSALSIYGTDITNLAREGKLDECFGREEELTELMEILVRRQKNNPVLIGEAGVGKTAIIELFATKLVNNSVPFVLEGRSIVSIDLARIIAGSRYRGEFELRLQGVLDEILEYPHIIMFIDEIHTLSGAGAAEGSLDAANILKPALSRSGFQCIGATTGKEYEKIEKDPALNRRFQPIKVKEPSVEDTLNILYGLRPAMEAFHNVTFLPGTLRLAAELSSRYIYERFLPDKAIDLVDRVAAREVLKSTTMKSGSIISSIVDGALLNIGKLKNECYRRGDLATLYIFQEVEFAYRRFLLEWVESPLTLPENIQSQNFTPLAEEFYEKIRLAVLKHVDDLLFASPLQKKKVEVKEQSENLSPSFNRKLFLTLRKKLSQKDSQKKALNEASLYRLSLYVLEKYLEKEEEKASVAQKEESLKTFSTLLSQELKDLGFQTYLAGNKKEVDQNGFFARKDFLSEDCEKYEEIIHLPSEVEETRAKTYFDFLKNLKPLIRKGLIESLAQTGNFKLSEVEIQNIYSLLGFFGEDTNNHFVAQLEEKAIFKNLRQQGNTSSLKHEISAEDIRNLISRLTGIPLQSVSSDESKRLLNLEDELHNRVIGQEAAISAISKAIRRSRLGIQNPNRPIASFMFCGPTGVGKTEVTKALAVSLFGSENDMIRFDMSEFMEKFTISRLIGSPPGYVGYEEGGQLTDAVRRKPYSVVLFDEVEKAHPEILNILLQILEDGRLTDTQKRLIPFENTVIIMTSNAGASEIQNLLNGQLNKSKTEQENGGSGSQEKEALVETSFVDAYSGSIQFFESPIQLSYMGDLQNRLASELKDSYRTLKSSEFLEKENKKQKTEEDNVLEKEDSELKEAVLNRLSTIFLPEFLNRLDDIVVFRPLSQKELRLICNIMIRQLEKRLELKQVKLKVEENVKTKLTFDAYNPVFGARPLRRMITKFVEDFVSEFLLKNPMTETKDSVAVRIFLNDDQTIQAEEMISSSEIQVVS